MSGTDDPAALGYEAARDELAEVVRALEAGGLSLEESLTLWERGEHLAAVCEQHLAGARQRIESAIAARGEPGEPAPNGGNGGNGAKGSNGGNGRGRGSTG